MIKRNLQAAGGTPGLQFYIVIFLKTFQKQDQKKTNLMVILVMSGQSASLPMVVPQHLVVRITLSDYGMRKQVKKKSNCLVTLVSIQSVSLLIVLLYHLVVMIALSDYWMLKYGQKQPNWMVIKVVSIQSVPLLTVLLQQMVVGITQSDYGMFKKYNKKKIVWYCVHSASFSPDETTLASSSFDFSIRLWDVKTGLEKAKLDGHFNAVQSFCFSPDGTTLASGGLNNSI